MRGFCPELSGPYRQLLSRQLYAAEMGMGEGVEININLFIINSLELSYSLS